MACRAKKAVVLMALVFSLIFAHFNFDLGVSAEGETDICYTVEIPSIIEFSGTETIATVKIYGPDPEKTVVIPQGTRINVGITNSDNNFILKLDGSGENGPTITYTVNGQNTIDALSSVATCGVSQINSGQISLVLTGTVSYAGTYLDKLTFTVSLMSLSGKIKILNPPQEAIRRDGEHLLQAATGANGTVTWVSKDPSVATVDESTGKVTALKPGETIITATETKDGQEIGQDSCKVIVSGFVGSVHVTEENTTNVNGTFYGNDGGIEVIGDIDAANGSVQIKDSTEVTDISSCIAVGDNAAFIKDSVVIPNDNRCDVNGTLNVRNGGRLFVQDGGILDVHGLTHGTLNINEGGIVDINEGGELAHGSKINVNGKINVSGKIDISVTGIINVNNNGQVNVSGNGQVNVSVITQFNADNPNGKGQINVSDSGQVNVIDNGTVTVMNYGQFNVSGSGQVNVKDSVTINVIDNGTVNVQENGQVNVNDSVTVNVNGSGQVNVKKDGQFNVNDSVTVNVNNSGQVNVKKDGQFNVKKDGQFSVNDIVTVNVNDSGDIKVESGGLVNVNDGSTVNVKSKCDVHGTLNVNDGGRLLVQNGGILDVHGTGHGILNVNKGGIVDINEGGELAHGSIINVSGKINVSGAVDVSGTGKINVVDNGQVNVNEGGKINVTAKGKINEHTFNEDTIINYNITSTTTF